MEKQGNNQFSPNFQKTGLKQESLEDVMWLVDGLLRDAKPHSLEMEVIASAFIYLKENPSVSISDALNYGYNEWIK